MKIAVLPSNQHLNDYAGITDRSITEEWWALRTSAAAIAEFERQGHTARMFHVPGAGSKSTDELSVMLRQAVAWDPDYLFSIHSDAAAPPTDILMLIRTEADRQWSNRIGRQMAERMGWPLQYSSVRGHNLLFFYQAPNERSILMEIGRHNTAEGAQFNVKYAEYEGIMAARSFLIGTGASLKSDGPVPVGIDVPPGQEKYKPVPVPSAPMPRLEVNWRQRHRLWPYTKDPLKVLTPAGYTPIGYLEWKLNKWYPEREAIQYRGVYDPTLEAAVRVFQLDQRLPVTGITDELFWDTLMAPGAP